MGHDDCDDGCPYCDARIADEHERMDAADGALERCDCEACVRDRARSSSTTPPAYPGGLSAFALEVLGWAHEK